MPAELLNEAELDLISSDLNLKRLFEKDMTSNINSGGVKKLIITRK